MRNKRRACSHRYMDAARPLASFLEHLTSLGPSCKKPTSLHRRPQELHLTCESAAALAGLELIPSKCARPVVAPDECRRILRCTGSASCLQSLGFCPLEISPDGNHQQCSRRVSKACSHVQSPASPGKVPWGPGWLRACWWAPAGSAGQGHWRPLPREMRCC